MDQEGWGDVPTSALEHPYVRLLQVVVLVIAIVLGLTRLGLLGGGSISLTTTRVTGSDPISAAASVARESHGGGAPVVIIAGLDALADGVVATGLAGALDAPILLNAAEELSPQTLDVVRELDVERAILIGGTNGLSDAVALSLVDDLEVEVQRIAGISRFDTARQVAEVFAQFAQPGELDGLRTALLVPAEDVPAGLEAGSLAATAGNPLPVLISQDGQLNDPTLQAIEQLGIEQLLVVGDLIGWQGPAVMVRGPAGAADVASRLRAFRPPRVVVVPDGDEPRSLIAGPLAGREAGVILTASTAQGWLRAACGTISELFVLAEIGTIDDAAVTALRNAASNCG